ncbi:MAG: isoprenyl transferase [Candidatus Brocadiia bacterium]
MKIPEHIAIIMDGNGRWAAERKLSRMKGHEAGADAVRRIIKEAARIGVKELTLYAFSRENWKRPKYEVNYLMRLLYNYLRQEYAEIMKNNLRFRAIGRIEELPEKVRSEIGRIIKDSSSNTGMVLRLALNYGSRTEIADAAAKISLAVKSGQVDPKNITEELFKEFLYNPDMPDPDLIIRTASEMRLSNFLLWQASYSELWVTPIYWPDFEKEHLLQAIKDYGQRERRFGGRGGCLGKE